MEVCKIHQQPFKYVPAGVSKKTNQPYQAFYSCPVLGCKEKPTSEQPPSNVPVQAPVGVSTSVSNPLPKGEPPMTRKDWNNKDFTEGFRALSYDFRKEDRHPAEAWDTTHLKEWMRTLYGDYEGYDEWETALQIRLAKLSKEWTKSDESLAKETIEENEDKE